MQLVEKWKNKSWMEIELFHFLEKNRFNCENHLEVKVAERRTDFKLLPPPRCHVGGLRGWGGGSRKAFKTWELLFPSVSSNLPSSKNVPPFFLCPLTSPNPHRSISQLSPRPPPPPLIGQRPNSRDWSSLIISHQKQEKKVNGEVCFWRRGRKRRRGSEFCASSFSVGQTPPRVPSPHAPWLF